MTSSRTTYTYRGGRRVALVKKIDRFVARVLPDKLKAMGIGLAEKVSSASSRVTVAEEDLEPMMDAARQVAPAHHAYHLADTDEEFLITDRVIVTFKNPLPASEVDAFAAKYALMRLEAYSERDYLFRLTDHTGMNPVKLVVHLTENDPSVAMAEHDLNYRIQTYQPVLPTDPFYRDQWHLHTRSAHPEFDPRCSSSCEEAWQALGHFGSPEIVIGVTDDGCKLDHPDFDTPGKFAGWGYFQGTRLVTNLDMDADPGRMYQPGANHGTSCAGVIAGEVNARLTVGAAPGCRLFPIKWESDGPSLFISASKLRTALEHLADKVDVLSNSWGVVPRNLWPAIVTDRLTQLARSGGRRGRGIVFLWAAGNENCPIHHSGEVDIPYTSGWSFREDGSGVWRAPRTSRVFENNLAGLPGVMHVAAVTSNARRSHYSNYGPGISLCAPSNNVHTYHRLTVPGLGVTTATGQSGLVTGHFGGTSSATPLAAGVAGLVLSANPDLSAEQVVSLLQQTAARDLDFTPYPRTPAASYDADTSWDVSPVAPFQDGRFRDSRGPDGPRSPWFGHGRLDAPAAVAAAMRLRGGGAAVLALESTPRLAIPDNDPRGGQDRIRVEAAGRLENLRVRVAIDHSWTGDLVVSLKPPQGPAVVLHNRAGAGKHDLRETYDMSRLPGLAALKGVPVGGEWTLQAADLADQDEGTLVGWQLEIEFAAAPLRVEDRESVPIPDNSPAGIERVLRIAGDPVVGDIAVAVDITHPWIGDLRVALLPPVGEPVVLHDRQGGSGDNIVRTWRSGETAGLTALRGQPGGGQWRLSIADLSGRDVGKLNRWSIELQGVGP
ncbi:MAG: S8 family serine peptidase [Desulfobacteraceae bacterium]|jgi:subtilisin-like proprotein convertase family protein